jgi:hypothetical protein
MKKKGMHVAFWWGNLFENILNLSFQIFTALKLKITDLWCLTPFLLVASTVQEHAVASIFIVK